MAKWWPFGKKDTAPEQWTPDDVAERKAEARPVLSVPEPQPLPPMPEPPPDVPAQRYCATTKIGQLVWHSACGAGASGKPPAKASVIVRSGHWF